jgi:hypothetical protein
MSDPVISKEALLERLKARLSANPGQAGIALHGELNRLGLSKNSDIVKEVFAELDKLKPADYDAPCRCPGCLFNVVCSCTLQQINHDTKGICHTFLGASIPRWQLALEINSAHPAGNLLRYEGGVIQRSEQYVAIMAEATGKTLPSMGILNKGGLSKELAQFTDFFQMIHKQTTLLYRKINALPSSSPELNTLREQHDALVEQLHGLYSSAIVILRKKVGTLSLLRHRVRPDINETVENYYQRVDSAMERIRKRLMEKSTEGVTSTEDMIRCIINSIGHAKLFQETYHGDVGYFCDQFWPGMTKEDIVGQYYLPIIEGSCAEPSTMEVVAEANKEKDNGKGN